MIGDDVEIVVVDIRGDKVRLGITAPRRIQVHRKEVYEAIKRENLQATKLKPPDVSEVTNKNAGRSGLQKKEKTTGQERKHNGDPSSRSHRAEG